MKALFDTSVLVAASVETHPMHARAWPWLKRAHGGEVGFYVAAHSLAECYAVLTVLLKCYSARGWLGSSGHLRDNRQRILNHSRLLDSHFPERFDPCKALISNKLV